MILAAGFGTRLLPYTTIRPKPLFPLLNQPLLLLTIKRLQRFGCDPIVVNCHHLADQIIGALSGIDGVRVIREETILGTGGGLRSAAHFFRPGPVLVTNGDIYHTVDYGAFFRFHQRCGTEVSLAMHDQPRFNCVEVWADKVISFGNGSSTPLLAFTGLHVIERDLLFDIEKDQFSSIIYLYKQMLNQDRIISSMRVDGEYWTDMGTVEDYLGLHGELLGGKVKPWQEFESFDPSTAFFSKDAKIGSNITTKDWACVGKATIGQDVVLKRSVIWDGAVVADGQVIQDTLVAPQ